jgi:hypothetical protein
MFGDAEREGCCLDAAGEAEDEGGAAAPATSEGAA